MGENLKINLVLVDVLCSFSNLKVSSATSLQDKLQDPRPHPHSTICLGKLKKIFSGVLQSQWSNKEGEGDGRGSPDPLNASIMHTRDVLSNWANKCDVNKIIYCITGWHIGIYEDKVY